jgi:ribosomal RNA-processing protein 36
MVLSRTLSRSLRAREEESDDEPYSDELEVSSPSVLDTGEGGYIGSPDPGSASETPDEEGDSDLVVILCNYRT